MINQYKKLFVEDIREKKRAANGVHSKTGLRGFVGKMRLPFEILSRKEKRAYKKCGKVVRYNMYDEIIALDEFKKLPEVTQSKVLQDWRQRFTNKKIISVWGLNSQQYYNLVKKLGIETQRSSKPRKVNKAVAAVAEVPEVSEVAEVVEMVPKKQLENLLLELQKQATQLAAATSPFRIEVNGQFESSSLLQKLAKLCALVEDEIGKFNVKISIEEIVEPAH